MSEIIKDKTDTVKELILGKIRDGEYVVGGKLPSIRELVQEYGVCKYTISNVLNSLEENGYIRLEPKKAPFILKRPPKHVIRVLYWSPSLTLDEFWDEFFRGVFSEIKNYPDYHFEFIQQHDHGFLDGVENIREFSGTLIIGSCMSNIADRAAVAAGRPLVYLYDYPLHELCSYVSSDFNVCMETLVRNLVRSGCRELGWCGTAFIDGINLQKLILLEKYAAQYGISFREEHKIKTAVTMLSLYEKVKKFCCGRHPVDAIAMSTDRLANPVLRAIHDMRKSVPEDIRLIGCDNLTNEQFLTPSLTTIKLNRFQQAVLAVRELIQQIENPEIHRGCRISVPAEIIYRESLTEK